MPVAGDAAARESDGGIYYGEGMPDHWNDYPQSRKAEEMIILSCK